jgi:voltage-gated sodium channel
MIYWARRIADGRRFQNFILGVILVNAVLVGLETSREIVEAHDRTLEWLNFIIQTIFVFEIGVRLLAYWPRLHRFFRDGWNVFDFVIVVLAMLPAGGGFATVARLARLLRVVRLVSVFPELRLMVGTMIRSFGSMGNVVLLLGLVIYVYAVLGYHFFGEADPAHWGTLGLSVLTLFQMLTLEGWVELQAIGLTISPYAWIYYGSFVLLAVFIVVNLFIAVVINNLEAVKAEEQAAEAQEQTVGEHEILHRIQALKTSLNELEILLQNQQQNPITTAEDEQPPGTQQRTPSNPT